MSNEKFFKARGYWKLYEFRGGYYFTPNLRMLIQLLEKRTGSKLEYDEFNLVNSNVEGVFGYCSDYDEVLEFSEKFTEVTKSKE